mgnify:FL=1
MSGILFFYVILFWYVFYTLKNYLVLKQENNKHDSFIKPEMVSVIVPFRNEAHHLPELIKSLQNQTHLNFEVLLIDDDSTDHTYKSIAKTLELDSRFKYYQLLNGKGKKAALEFGVSRSNSSIIVTTDADCTTHDSWLYELTVPFENEKIQLVGATVGMKYSNWFEKLQALEFSSLIASSIAAAQNNKPIMLNAANMAFRKQLFTKVNSKMKALPSPSGDDIFLLQYCLKYHPGGFYFLNSKGSYVETQPEPTLAHFINQRRRWASKSKYYLDNEIRLVSLLVFFTNVFVVYGFVQLLLGKYFLAWLFPILLKGVVDYLLLKKYLRAIEQVDLLNYFVILEILHPFYIIFVAISSQFGRFSWKKRTYPI